MESNTPVPGESHQPSNHRPPSDLDRDIGEEESLAERNIYNVMSDHLEQPREQFQSHSAMEQSSNLEAMNEDNNLDDRKSKLSIVGHFVAEFLGVAKNDSSDEEYSDIDHPDGRESNVMTSGAGHPNGLAAVHTHRKKTRKISNQRKLWENRRLRLAARKYGGLKDIEDDTIQSRVENASYMLEDQIDSNGSAPKYLAIQPKSSFIEYSKEAYQWMKSRCCGNKTTPKDKYQQSPLNSFVEKINSSNVQSEESTIVEEDEFFQNNVSSQDIVDDGRVSSGGATTVVGLSRIRQSTLENLEDNSHRRPSQLPNNNTRQYGIGLIGKLFGNKSISQSRNRYPPMLNRSNIRHPLDEAEDYRPYFTYWVTTVQVLIMILSLLWYGVANFGVELSQVKGFIKTERLMLEQISYYEPSNFWLGPRAADLIHLGAKYSPCMRQDVSIEAQNVMRNNKQANSTGCCVRNDNSGCLQTYEEQCSTQLSTFHKWGGYYGLDKGPDGRRSGPVCGQDPRYCHSPVSQAPYNWVDDITHWPICKKPSVEVGLGKLLHSGSPPHVTCELTGRPCCVGIHGRCEIRSAEYCQFVNGHFHPEATLCSQVSCMSDVCGMLSFGKGGRATDQVYRLWTSLFLHAGVVHLTITILVQYYLMSDLEKMCGPVRIGLIYLGSGIIGNLASAIFVPHRAESGPAGSHFGLLAALVVECINAWPILRYPGRAMARLLVVLLFLLILGFLPWVDNYAHTFGFIGGFLLSFAFLPYLTFSNSSNNSSSTHCSSILYARKGRLWVIIMSLVLVIVMIAMLLIVFYLNLFDCEWCKYLSCIPFTDRFCADQNINLERSETYLF